MQNSSAFFGKKPTIFLQSVRVFAQYLWKSFLEKNFYVIDATCGRGKDTLFLAKLVENGHVYAYDIQESAIQQAKKYIQEHHTKKNVSFFHQSHTTFNQTADLVVYNLGYLPGSNRKIQTEPEKVITSLESALCFAKAVSITCYPGHPMGKFEESHLLSFTSSLCSKEWNVSYHKWPNRRLCPSLLWLTRN